MHHLAADLPVAEVTGLAREAGAGLIVLSSATAEAARAAGAAVEEIARSSGPPVLTGQPGDSLSHLKQLARATVTRSAE